MSDQKDAARFLKDPSGLARSITSLEEYVQQAKQASANATNPALGTLYGLNDNVQGTQVCLVTISPVHQHSYLVSLLTENPPSTLGRRA
jgi:hypothetical protein